LSAPAQVFTGAFKIGSGGVTMLKRIVSGGQTGVD
jgi:hypothetical protein